MQILEFKNKLNASFEHLHLELSKIRTGRATPALVESIPVDVYGTKMLVKELGTISVPDAQMLLISPWDKGVLKAIDRAIREGELGVNPVTDSETVRVPIPSLTEERRKELARAVSVRVEECKSSIRNIRQDEMKSIDKEFSDRRISEDEKFTRRDEIEKITKNFISDADEIGEVKKAEILKV